MVNIWYGPSTLMVQSCDNIKLQCNVVWWQRSWIVKWIQLTWGGYVMLYRSSSNICFFGSLTIDKIQQIMDQTGGYLYSYFCCCCIIYCWVGNLIIRLSSFIMLRYIVCYIFDNPTSIFGNCTRGSEVLSI